MLSLLKWMPILALIWSVFHVGVAIGYDPSLEDAGVCISRKSNCNAEIELYGKKVVMPCSVASGSLPLQVPPTLPLFFEGNYDLCKGFPMAHYCTIRTGFLAVILGIPKTPDSQPDVLPLGEFRLNQCVSKKCSAEILKGAITRQVTSIAHIISKLLPSQLDPLVEVIEDMILQDLQVDCAGEEAGMDGFGVIVVILCCALVVCTLGATILHMYAFGKRQGGTDSEELPTLVEWFSMKYNCARLFAPVPGDFNALNGIRVLSMVWIISGHTLLQFMSPPVTNPNAIQNLLTSFTFVLVRGAEYAVDTFFFLSAFLAVNKMLPMFAPRAKREPRAFMSSFGNLVIGRYIRLTPSYAMVIFFCWKVLPLLGSGPLWNEFLVNDRAMGISVAQDVWWANILYVNNLYPWESTKIFLGYSWYLANDMQFFLATPFIIYLYFKGRECDQKSGRYLLCYGPSIFLIGFQIISTIITFVHFDLNGSMFPIDKHGEHFIGHVYFKPWTRMTPYVVGILAAIYHYELVNKHGDGWKKTFSKHMADLSFLLAFSCMIALVCTHYLQWKCKESEQDCNAYMGYSKIGFFVLPNWSQGFLTVFYSFAWIIWTGCLAVVAFYFFLDYDIAGVKWFLAHPIFIPLARLTYGAYLVHMPIMCLVHYSQPKLPFFAGWNVFGEVILFVFVAYSLSAVIYYILEKPVMNASTMLFFARKTRERYRALERNLSTLSDVDSEVVAMSHHHHHHGEENQGTSSHDYQALDQQHSTTVA